MFNFQIQCLGARPQLQSHLQSHFININLTGFMIHRKVGWNYQTGLKIVILICICKCKCICICKSTYVNIYLIQMDEYQFEECPNLRTEVLILCVLLGMVSKSSRQVEETQEDDERLQDAGGPSPIARSPTFRLRVRWTLLSGRDVRWW